MEKEKIGIREYIALALFLTYAFSPIYIYYNVVDLISSSFEVVVIGLLAFIVIGIGLILIFK